MRARARVCVCVCVCVYLAPTILDTTPRHFGMALDTELKTLTSVPPQVAEFTRLEFEIG